MEKKSSSSSSLLFFFKSLHRKSDDGGSSPTSSNSGSRRWKLKSSAGLFRWKRRFNLHIWFVDRFLFKIVSVLEGIVLVSTLCVFFVCCGCHF